MTAVDVRKFESRLRDMVRRLSAERVELRHEVFGEAEDRAAQEQQTNDELIHDKAGEEVALSLLDNEEALLGECTAALERIKLGTFGRCEECAKPISCRRLDAAPHARKCMRCTRKAAVKQP